MKNRRNESDRIPEAWKAALCGLAAWCAFIHCDMQTAGTSVGTGNPTEIQVSFTNDSGAVAITGTMAVYASTQIPVPGFEPSPLVSVPINGATNAVLKVDAFKSLADSLWPKTSQEGGTYRFNVVVTGEARGAILQGLSFRKKEGDFVLRAEDTSAARNDNRATVIGAMVPLVSYQGRVDISSFNRDWDYYLYVVGTGFAAKQEGGKFSIPKLPSGTHQGYVMPIPTTHSPLSDIDSTFIFGLVSPLETGRDSLALGPVVGSIPLPSSLKAK